MDRRRSASRPIDFFEARGADSAAPRSNQDCGQRHAHPTTLMRESNHTVSTCAIRSDAVRHSGLIRPLRRPLPEAYGG
jgi:hypothetical protein